MAKVTCELLTVTPNMAHEWLNGMGKNRRVRQGRIDLYAQQMKRGDWMVTGQGLAFDERGKLIDGQHRLAAVIKADKPIEMMVTRGLKVGTQLVLDQPIARQIHDQISLDRGLDVTSRHVAVAKQMMLSIRVEYSGRLIDTRDTPLVERFYMKHHNAIAYAVARFTKVVPGVTLASVMAVMARAYYCTDEHELLAEFANILTTGFTETRTASAAIALRNFLIAGKVSARKTKTRVEIYKRTELALAAFLKREPMLHLPKTDLKQELFPLPEEVTAMKIAAKPTMVKKVKAVITQVAR